MSVGLLIASLLYSKPSAAAPGISWQPTSITETVVPGKTQVVRASFTASENMSNAVVRVDPALRSVVKLLPANLANVQQGQTVTLSIVFSSSPTALPGSFQGAIRLLIGSTTIVDSLPVTVSVVWPTFDGSKDLGITIDTPPAWYAASKQNAVAFSNVQETGDVSETTLQTESFFQVSVRPNDNPLRLPVAQWFSDSMRPLIADQLYSEMPLSIDGYDAVEVDISAVGGRRRYIYVARGTDVIEITFGLYAPKFIDAYLAMLNSLRLAP